MRNARVFNIPVGLVVAWILALGYAVWAVEAVGARAVAKKAPCSVPVVERSERAVSNNS